MAVEGLPFRVTAAGYESTLPPLFVKDLSVGDVISAEVDDDGLVEAWRHVSRSRNSVVWLLRIGPTDQTEGVLEELQTVGCRTVSLPSSGCHAIDVPENVSIELVDVVLGELDSAKVAVAYPSFRHAEYESEE